MNDPVAALEVVGIMHGGKRLRITARIGRPQPQADGRWACAIAIAPLDAKIEDVRGTDSFHAVWLACALVLKLLGNLKAEGWQLLNDDGSEFPLDAYLAGLAADPRA